MAKNKTAADETATAENNNVCWVDEVIKKAKELALVLRDVPIPSEYLRLTVTPEGFWFSNFNPLERGD